MGQRDWKGEPIRHTPDRKWWSVSLREPQPEPEGYPNDRRKSGDRDNPRLNRVYNAFRIIRNAALSPPNPFLDDLAEERAVKELRRQ